MLLHPSGCVAIPTRGKRTASSEKSAEQAQKSSSIDVSVCAMVCAFGGKTQLGEGHIVDEEMLCSGAKREKKALHHPQSGAARYHSLDAARLRRIVCMLQHIQSRMV